MIKGVRKSLLSFLTVCSILLLLVVSGCGSSASSSSSGKADTSPAKGAASSETITVNVAQNGGMGPLAIIQEKGWLEEEFQALNAKVIWSEFASGPPLLESLVAGRVDLSLLGDGAALQGQAAGLPFIYIANISTGTNVNTIVVPASSEIKSIPDLKGKQIALAKGTTSHVFLLKVLDRNGLTEKDVSIVNLQFPDALPVFQAGQVDAWVTVDPYTTQLIDSKEAVILAGADQNILAPGNLIARTPFSKEHPELVTAYLKVYLKAVNWQNEHVDEAAELIANKKKVSPELMKKLMANSQAILTPVTDEVIDTQQLSADLLVKEQFLKKPIQITDYVDNSFINTLLEK